MGEGASKPLRRLEGRQRLLGHLEVGEDVLHVVHLLYDLKRFHDLHSVADVQLDLLLGQHA